MTDFQSCRTVTLYVFTMCMDTWLWALLGTMLSRRRGQSHAPAFVQQRSAPLLPPGLAFRTMDGSLCARTKTRRTGRVVWKLRHFVLQDDQLLWYKLGAMVQRGQMFLGSVQFASVLDAKEARAVSVPRSPRASALSSRVLLRSCTCTRRRWANGSGGLPHCSTTCIWQPILAVATLPTPASASAPSTSSPRATAPLAEGGCVPPP